MLPVVKGWGPLFFGLLMTFVITPAMASDIINDAQDSNKEKAPKWALEFKVGSFEPDLDEYKTFYGSDSTTMWAIAGAYRFTNWLEFGLELGYSKDEGEGLLPNAGTQGGDVEYTLMPLQAFFNLRYDVTPDQLFVPYAGAGIVTAWYKQEVDLQSDNKGRTDIGGAARIGIQLSLNRLDKGGANYVTGTNRLKGYIFLEGQYFSTKIDDIDLGGDVYMLGLRFEFD